MINMLNLDIANRKIESQFEEYCATKDEGSLASEMLALRVLGELCISTYLYFFRQLDPSDTDELVRLTNLKGGAHEK